MKAIMVKSSGGCYEMIGSAEAESWDEVEAAAGAVEKIEDLVGWGEWIEAYRVTLDGVPVTYFVASDDTP